jgi:hypothetical protein
MHKKPKLLATLVLLCVCLGIPILPHAQAALPGEVTPENTVILANATDARFSRDFSVLLKQLRVEWVVLDDAVVPDSVRDQNLVILGYPDAAYTGEIIRSLLTAEEIETLLAATDRHVVIEIESPWTEGRTVTICSGADTLLTRNAADEAVRAMITATGPTSAWVQTTYDIDMDQTAYDAVARLRYQWDDEELPLEDLAMDFEAHPPRRVSAQEAAEDVERLFNLLSHGYAGYAYFNQHGAFEQARERILQELPSQSSWPGDDFAQLLHEHLRFIVDSHMKIEEYPFANHADFWYDTDLELTLGDDGYQFVADGDRYTALAINGGDPGLFLRPSLNQNGEPIYRLSLLSTEKPDPLLLTATSEAGERQFEIDLQRSDFEYYSDDIFREEVIGGIPVVRARGFGDYYADDLSQFVQTGSRLRGESVVILDIRGNSGGNELWPINWILELTGRRAESVLIRSQLESKTSIMGRANYFNYYNHELDMSNYGIEGEQHTHIAEMIESKARQPGWTGPIYPQVPLISNDTTVIVVMNEYVASAGEGAVMRISQAENVVVVGENSMGALTFGNVSLHQLPNSKLKIWLPINFNLFQDLESREEVGLAPDLWVPAADAVNYAVAAVRNGTISTAQLLPSEALAAEFIPENPWASSRKKTALFLMVVVAIPVGGSVFAYSNRKKPHLVMAVSVVWLAFGSLWLINERENPVGYGFALTGILCLIWGGYGFWSARSKDVSTEKRQ